MTTAMVLQACGGGGDPSVPDNLDELGLTQAFISISTSSSTITQGENQTNTVSVSLTDQNGSVLGNEIVQLSTTLGTVDGNGSATTNSLGVATFNITLTGATAGDAGTLTATYNNDEFNISVSQNLNVNAGAPADNFEIAIEVLNSGDNESVTTLTPDTGNRVRATLTNNGNASANQTIAFTSSHGTLSSATATTGSDGTAIVNLASSGVSDGDNTVSVEIAASHTTSDTNTSITVESGIDTLTAELTIVVGDGTSDTIAQDTITEIFVTLVDGDDVALSGKIVSLSTTSGTITGSGRALTDATGQARFEIVVSGETEDNPITLTADYTDTGVTATQTKNVKAGASPSGTGATYSISMAALGLVGEQLDSFNGNTIQVTLSSENGGVVSDRIITLNSSLGSLSNTSIRTNSSGVATAILFSAGTTQGTAGNVTASFDDGAGASASDVTLVVEAGPEAALSISINDSLAATPELSQSTANTIEITLTDPSGAIVENALVSLSSTLGILEGNGQSVTGSDGVAEFSLTLSDTTEGVIGQVTATYSDTDRGITLTDFINVVAGEDTAVDPEADFTVDVVVQNSSGTTVTTLDPVDGNIVQVHVTNADGDVAGAVVNLSTDIGTLGLTEVLTDSSGIATTTLSSGDVTPGQAGTITASYTNNGTPYEDDFSVQAGQSVSLDINVVGALDTPPKLSQSVDNAISVTLQDASGDALSNRIVNLSSTLGTVEGNGSAVTDSSGVATFTIVLRDATENDAGVISASFQDDAIGINATENLTVVADVEDSSVNDDEFTVSITVTDGTGADGNILTPDGGNSVSISLTDKDGVAQGGQVVLLGTTVGSLSPSQVLTAADGTATATLTSSDVTEGQAGTLTASYENDGNTYVGNFNVQAGESSGSGSGSGTSTGDVVLTVTIQDSTGAETSTLDTSTGNNIRIVLQDTSGNPLTSEIVTITTTIGSLEPSNGSVLTNSSGIASARINSEGLEEGTAGIVTVSYENSRQGISATEPRNVQAGETIGSSTSVTTLVATLYEERTYLLNPPTTAAPDIDTTKVSELSQINAIQPAIFEVRMTTDGVAVEGAIISVETSLGEISPSSGNVITDELGIATLTLSIGDAESGEAGTIVARTSDNVPSNNVTFSIGSSNLALGTGFGATFMEGELEITDDALEAGGSTEIKVNVVNTETDNSSYTTPIEVEFTSECVETGLASMDTSVTTSDGTASVTYTANGCVSDNITATLASVDGPSADGSLTVTDSTPSSISFESATPTNIALKGTGGNGRQESSEVQFIVIDNTGDPEAGVTVNFELSTEAGGVSLVSTSGVTDSNGLVIARVDAGNIPTPVRVSATIDGTSISTVSDVLVISTGLPDQGSFTMSASVINPGGGNTDGVTTDITIRAADAFNNPVPDGTAISFTTEFGAIQDACTTESGACTVTWNSQSPRSQINFTADDITVDSCTNLHQGTFSVTTTGMPCRNGDFAVPHGAYSNILAYAIGEETFIDANANGVYDSGEVHQDIGEAFIDHNDNDAYDNPNTTGSCADLGTCPASPGEGGDEETFVDFNTNGEFDGGNGIYNGSLCSDTAEAAGDCSKDLVNVFENINIVMSGNTPYFSLYQDSDGAMIGGTGSSTAAGFVNNPTVDLTALVGRQASLSLFISDYHNGPLPAGTTVNLSSTNCTIQSTTSFEFASNAGSFMEVGILIVDDEEAEGGTGSITTTVTLPDSNGGASFSYEFICVDL